MTSSWKQKVDPAFDGFIKLYLEVLKLNQLPGDEGYLALNLDEKALKKTRLEGYPSIAIHYENDRVEDIFIDVEALLGSRLTRDDFKKAKREAKKKNGVHNLMLAAIEEIESEESRAYYLESIALLNSEISPKVQKKIHSDILSLVWHANVQKINRVREELKRDKHIVRKRISQQSKLFTRNIFFMWDTISLLVNKKSLKQLFIDARKGDDASLFKLIKVDKTLFDHEWVRLRIRKALYEGDWKFFDNLSKAIKADPLENRRLHGELILVLLNFWKVGLYRLTVPQLRQLLCESGINIKGDDVTFRKFKDREIKLLFKGW